jgi:hypothetical protein
VTGARQPYYLITGQAFDPRWRATMDGHHLGAPVPLDGYAAGWRIDAPGDHTISVRYAGQGATDAAVVGSGVVALGCVLLVALARPGEMAGFGGGSDPRSGGGSRPGGPPATESFRRRSWYEVRRRGEGGRWWRRAEEDGRREDGGRLALRRRTLPPVLRRLLGWAVVVLAAWVLGGIWLAAPATLLAGWHLVRPPGHRLLIAGAVGVLVAVPIAWLALRPDTGGQITARIVLDDPWPGRLAAFGLLLLVLGVVRADRADRTDGDRPDGADGSGAQ